LTSDQEPSASSAQPPSGTGPDPQQWLADHGDAMWRFALSRLRDPHAAEEAVQETFLAALKARDSFRGESSERTWLISILRHKIADRRRKSARDPAPLAREDPVDVLDTMFDARGRWRINPGRWPRNPDRVLEQPEFWQDLERCLSLLPANLAEAFILREVRRQTGEAICEMMSITLDNLWVRLHRARLLLRKCLERQWGKEKGR
jgi:RNA polymerase sigma-70 factor (TIGR02943 family)